MDGKSEENYLWSTRIDVTERLPALLSSLIFSPSGSASTSGIKNLPFLKEHRKYLTW